MKRFSMLTLVGALLFVTSFLSVQIAAASYETLEYMTLVELYESTDGDSWTRADNWLDDSVHYCDWYGVTCNSSGYVQQIILNTNALDGPIPPALGNLGYLEVLILSYNRLNGPIPQELGNISSLRQLSLWHTELTGSIPPELGNLSQLEELDLEYNQLSGSIPPALGNLLNLKFLSVTSNNLQGSIPAELGKLSKIELLFLAANQLDGPIPPELGNLDNLSELWLHMNQLSGPIPPELGNAKSLSWLSISNNQLSGEIPPELGKLSNLGLLWLHENQLSGPIPREFGDLANLWLLDLSSNNLTGSVPAELDSLSWLEWIDLESNRLSCWETQSVLDWAIDARETLYGKWDYPYPGEVVCPCHYLPGNILANSCFEASAAPWAFYSNGWGSFETTTPAFDGSFSARVEALSTASNVQFYQYNLPLEPDQQYRLYFAAKSSDGRDLSVYVHKHDYPYSNYGLNGEPFDLTTGWQQFQVDFTTNSLAAADGRLRFWLAPYAAPGTVYWFDNVYLVKITDGVPEPPDPDPLPVEVPPEGHCSPPVAGNVLGNPGFEAGALTPWSFYTNGKGYTMPVTSTAYQCAQSARVLIKQQGSNVQLFQPGLALQPNTSYRLRLAAKSTGGRDVRLYLHKHGAPYTNYGLNGLPLDLTEEWQVFVVQFTTTSFSLPVSDGRLRIWLAESDAPDAQYYFDDVVMVPLSTANLVAPESLSEPQSFAQLDRQASSSAMVTSPVLTSGYFIDDDDAGRDQGAFLPTQPRARQCENAQPSHAMLWPADGRMVKIKIVGAGKPAKLTIDGIWQDEPVGAEPDGLIAGEEVLLRAERLDSGSGRVYHVAFSATYSNGLICSHEVLITVPLQKGTAALVFDNGPLAVSTRP